MKTGTVTSAMRQGPRSHQEDYIYQARIQEIGGEGFLLAVMDGHGGKEVAEFCAQEMGRLFEFRNQNDGASSLKRLVSDLHMKTALHEAGSTLSVVLVVENHDIAYAAVLGDSPIIIFDTVGMQHIGPEHNVRSNPDERRATRMRGADYAEGYIYPRGGFRGLQLSRALGNASLDSVLSREPEIMTVSNPQWVLVASDGLIDPSHAQGNKYLSAIKNFAMDDRCASDVMAWAEERGLRDNATALVWNRGRK